MKKEHLLLCVVLAILKLFSRSFNSFVFKAFFHVQRIQNLRFIMPVRLYVCIMCAQYMRNDGNK